MVKRLLSILVAVACLFALAPSARAELSARGTAIDPHGYPAYFQDSSGLRLEPCLLPLAGQADPLNGATMCIGDPVNPANQASVALGVGDETFWWMAEAQARPLVAGGKALLTLALEGAFGGVGVAADGQQIAFGRIRIRVDVPVAGTYTITHPFGQIVFPNVTVADGINMTEDIGNLNFLFPDVGFNGALSSKIGPFLTWPNYADPVANPGLRVVDPVSGAVLAQYVGDPAIPHVVTGSPSGNNLFRIQGPPGSGIDEMTDLFTVMGRVYSGAVGTAHVFPAVPPQNLLAVGPVNRTGDVGAITPAQPEGVRTGTQLSGYPVGFPIWYQANAGTPAVPAAGVQVTLCPAVDPMCISAPVDPANPQSAALGVGDEAFWWSAEAFINDRTADLANPQGVDALLVLALEGAFGGTGVVQEGNQMAFGRVRIRVNVPTPGTYTITHPYGTEVFNNVTVADGINITRDIGIIDPSDPAGAFVGALYSDIGPNLLTWPDFANPLVAGNEVLQRPVSPNPPTTIVQYLGDPTIPHVVTGSPTGNNFFRVQGPGGINVQTGLFVVTGKVYDPATFRVIPNPAAPVAADDTARVDSGGSVVIGVLANDSIGGAAVNPANVTVNIIPAGVFGPADGTVVVNADKTVTYTSTTPGFVGTDDFAYTITDAVSGLTSNTATVTVTVLPVETITVTRAQLDLRRLLWNIQGQDNIEGATLTVHAGPTLAGPVIGRALVTKGRWQLRSRATTNPGVTSISIQSSTGKVLLNQPLQTR